MERVLITALSNGVLVRTGGPAVNFAQTIALQCDEVALSWGRKGSEFPFGLGTPQNYVKKAAMGEQ